MADLVTHATTVLLPAVFVRSRAIPIAVAGAVLPDLVSRVPGVGFEKLYELGLPIPDWIIQPWGVCHEPVPLLLICALLALLFREADRPLVLGALGVGVAAHLGLDLLQDHHGHGYHLLFPLSSSEWEAGWLHSEATVRWAPWLGLATAVAWALRWAQGARAASANTPASGPGPTP